MITKIPKKIGCVTCKEAVNTSASVNNALAFSSRRRKIFSVITIAPSTIIPKSIAPNDNRFAGISKLYIQINAVTKAIGMVMATIKAARILPRKNSNTSVTRPMPYNSVSPTVCTVA